MDHSEAGAFVSGPRRFFGQRSNIGIAGVGDDFFSQGTRNEMCIRFFSAGREWRAPTKAVSSRNAATPLRAQDRAGAGGSNHARSRVAGERAGHHNHH
jgi:hypothetical protein